MDEQGYYLQPQQSSNLGIQSQLQQQQQQQQQPTTQQQMNQQPSQQQSQQQQGNINNNNNINTPLSYTQNLNGYQNGGAHQMAAHIPFHPQNHPAAYLAAGSQHLIDYSQLPGNQAAQQNYSLPTHYTPQLHHGYGQQPDQYLSQSYQQQQQQQPFEYDPSNQLNTLSYYAPQTGVNITAATTTDSSAGAGNIIPNGLQAQSTYGQYPPPLLSSQQHYQLDPNSQSSAPYGQQQSQQQQQQYHAHQISHPVLDQTNNYLQFGQQNTYPGGQNHPYLPFNTTMQSIHNGQIHTHSPYGLLSNPNQIGLIDPSLQGRQQQPQQIGKASIKSEEQAMENELNLLNSLGDSQSQIEDKLKQNNGQFMVPQTYEQQQQQQQQQAYQYYALGSQNFQGYPTYPQGQIQQPLQQVPSQQQQQQPISPLQAPGSANSLKDKDEKRQPNSPGRKKAIKKGSPTTEPSSPASPRGRKRKNTGKNGELEGISPTLKPSGLTLIQQSSQPVQSQNSGAQFGLHLMKVPSQPDPFDARKQQLGFLGNVAQPNYGQLGIQNNMMLDPGNMQQISNIDQSSLQRLKELPTDFNLSDFAGVNDEQKQIGTISKEERKQKIKNYQEKRKKRSWAKKISYDVRKKVADSRLRDKGRFVTKKQAMEMLSLSGREEEFTMDQLKEMLKQRGILQPTGGDEDSKSPTFQSKNPLICSEQPRRLGSLKPGEEYEGQEFDQEVRSEEQLPNDGMLVLNRGRSCEGNLLTTTNNNNKNEFAGNNNNSNNNISQNLQFFSEMVKNSNNNNINNLKVIDGNSNENGMINNSENQLLLKLEQKENDNLNKPFKQASQQQLQQQQQQQQPQLSQQPNAYRQYSQSPPQSQSPLRSPNKQNNNLPHKLIELIPTQQQQQSPQQQQNILSSQGNLQEGIKSNSILQQDMLGNTNQPSNNFPIETQESPGSQNNILSQEVADQFGNLNIKSPDQKHQKLIANNPQMISLAEQSGTNNHFFGGQQQQQQQQQNYILHNGQQPYSNVGNNSNNNNTGYPIHQQQ